MNLQKCVLTKCVFSSLITMAAMTEETAENDLLDYEEEETETTTEVITLNN